MLHIVEVSTVQTRDEAQRLTQALRGAGFDPYLVWTGKGYATRLGAFRARERADTIKRAAALRGFQARIIEAQ